MRKFISKILAVTLSMSLFSGIAVKPIKAEASTVKDTFMKVFEQDSKSKYLHPKRIIQSEDGYIIVAGEMTGDCYIDGNRLGSTKGGKDLFVVKLNSNGVFDKKDRKCFSTVIGGSYDDFMSDIIEKDGYLYVLGATKGPGGDFTHSSGYGIGVFKLDNKGVVSDRFCYSANVGTDYQSFYNEERLYIPFVRMVFRNDGNILIATDDGYYLRFLVVNPDTMLSEKDVVKGSSKLNPGPNITVYDMVALDDNNVATLSRYYYDNYGSPANAFYIEIYNSELDSVSKSDSSIKTGQALAYDENSKTIANFGRWGGRRTTNDDYTYYFNLLNKDNATFNKSVSLKAPTKGGILFQDIVNAKDGGWLVTASLEANSNKGNSDSIFKRDGKALNGYDKNDALVCKLNADGDIVWSQVLGGYKYDEPTSIFEMQDGSVLLCGWTTGGASDSTFKNRTGGYIVKLDPDGNLEPTFTVKYNVSGSVKYYEDVIPNKKPDGYIPEMTKGKVFNGWYTSAVTNDPTKVLESLPKVTKDVTYYANISSVAYINLYDVDKSTPLNIVQQKDGTYTNQIAVIKGQDGTGLLPTSTGREPSGKVFDKWLDEYDEVPDLTNFYYDTDLYASYKDASYNVSIKYQNNAGTEVSTTNTVNPGSTVAEPVVPSPSADVTNITSGLTLSNVPNGKIFDGWYIEGTNTKVTFPYTPTANCTIVAKYSNAHTVTFTDSISNNINKYYVRTGKTLGNSNIPQATPKEGHTFSAWKSGSAIVNGNTTITSDMNCTPEYNINNYNYTIKYVNESDDEIQSSSTQSGAYNSIIPEPSRPNITGYKFKSWNNWNASTRIPANSNLIIKAVYAPLQYTVIFKDINNNTISTQTVNYGMSATPPEGKDSYVNSVGSNKYKWQGWNTGYENITNPDDTTPIIITPIANSNSNIRKLEVKFKGTKPDGQPIEAIVSNIIYGSNVTVPRELDVIGYNVTCDNSRLSNITENIEIPITYEKKEYTVTFNYRKAGQDVSATQKVKYQESAIPPTDGEVEGYDLTWDKAYNSIESDTVINAVYTIKKFTVTFKFNKEGQDITETVNNVNWGTRVTAPSSSEWYGYDISWDYDLTQPIKENKTINGTYSKKSYRVTFTYKKDNKDKTVEQQVKYKESAIPPAEAEIEGYDLTWDKDFSSIVADTDIRASYSIKKFTVTFRFTKDGNPIEKVVTDVEWGSTVTAPQESEWYGHVITWDYDLNQPIKENKTINGVYDLDSYTVKFVDDNGGTLHTISDVDYDTTIQDPNITVEKAGYRHDGWLLDGNKFKFGETKVTRNLVLKPKWIRTRTVTFYDYDNIKLNEVTVDDGNPILQSDIPIVTKEGYRFKYWVDESNTEADPLSTVNGDKIYRAVMVRQITITYVDINGEPITTKTVDSGSSIPGDVIAPSREDVGYDFVKWDRVGEVVHDDTIVRPVYQIKTFNVHLEATKPDGSRIEKDIVCNWGAKADVPSEFNEPGYSIKWEPSIDSIKSNISSTGTYKPGKHIVNFLDKNGVILKTITEVDYNSSVENQAPEAPKVKGYTFTGWDKDLTHVLGDTDYRALYEINKYRVQFVDLEGNKLGAEQLIDYNKPATPPSKEDIPTVDGKVFKGWSTDIEHIYAENKDEVLIIKPVYGYNNKRVVHLDMNGNLLQERYVQINEDVAEPIPPEIAGHQFIGWKASENNCETLQIFTAIYSKLSYKVTFMNTDNSVLKEEDVEYGNSATEPDVTPTKEGHTFKGWSDDFSFITKPLILTPVFSGEEFTVKFIGANGEVISEQKVEYGEAATAPADPIKDGYTFNGWLQTFSNVKSDLIIYPSFTENYEAYTVTFVDYADKTLSSQRVRKGSNANPPTEVPDYNGKKFERWNLDYTNVNKDMVIKAVYKGQYLVKFLNTDESLLSVAIVDEGKDAVAPSIIPIKDGYVFSNWDLDYTKVNKDMTIRPVFKLKDTDVDGNTDKTKFTVTFVDYDGDEIDVQTVAKGESAKAPSDPKRSGYVFKGWSKDFDNVQSDLTVKAKYKSKDDNDDNEEYTVKFYGKNGELLKTETVEEGEDAIAPTAPKIDGYEFKRWSRNFESVESDLTVNAIYGTYTSKDDSTNTSDNSNTNNDSNNITNTLPNENTNNSGATNQAPSRNTNSNKTVSYSESGQTTKSNVNGSAYKQSQPVKVASVNTSTVKASNTKANKSPIDYSDVFAKQEALKKTQSKGITNISLGASPIGSEDVDSADIVSEDLYESPVLNDKDVYESTDSDLWKYMLLYSGMGLLGVLGLAGLIFARRPRRVVFLDDDENTIFESKVKKGSGVLPPDPPEKDGFEFVGWDTDFTEIKKDTIVHPVYKEVQ